MKLSSDETIMKQIRLCMTGMYELRLQNAFPEKSNRVWPCSLKMSKREGLTGCSIRLQIESMVTESDFRIKDFCIPH